MKPERFELALQHLRPSDWKKFEELASRYLAPDFRELRTVASASGDKGRDAFLFSSGGDPTVLIQYSIGESWQKKIRDTARQIKEEFPKVTVLIYVTNLAIGAKADAIRSDIRRDFNVVLDVRDRSWFMERLHTDRQREVAAEALAEQIVDPYLMSKDVVGTKAQALSSLEARAALVHLTLQWEDDNKEKGLTKLCFEALVRAVLRATDPEHRLHGDAIRAEIRKILPSHPGETVDLYTDSALKRLTKRSVRHYVATEEYCLSHEERVRLKDRLAEFECSDVIFQDELKELVRERADRMGVVVGEGLDVVVARVRRVLEKFLMSRGEHFAAAVKTGEPRGIGFDGLHDLIISDVAEHRDIAGIGAGLSEMVEECVTDAIVVPSHAAQAYLRSLADSYTLLAFLRETADVQSALVKMFSEGEIWLDTSLILPLFAEELLEVANRRFGNMLLAARECGLRLRMTGGVLEEIERHVNRSLICWRSKPGEWEGSVPFLFSAYASSGRSLADFGRWMEQFCGAARPADDLAIYLRDVYGVELGSLEAEAGRASVELRGAVQEIWHAAHERRKSSGARDIDPISAQRLVAHDVENYLGVVIRRTMERDTPLGYTTWWLTLHRTAFGVREELKKRLASKPPDSPVLSPDFLVSYLAFGPIRMQMSKRTEAHLPVVLDIGAGDFLPPELLEVADRVRDESRGLPERVIQRRVRDALDAARSRMGRIVEGGITAMQRDLERSIGEKKPGNG